MKHYKKIAIIGGTGKSGKYLVKQLLKENYTIKVLLRHPERFQTDNPLAETLAGNVCNYEDIHALLEGCDAIISTLGMGIPASEPTIFSQSTANVIKAMSFWGIKRYIVTTGLNVDTPQDKKNPRVAMATEWMKTTYPLSTSNKQLEYELLAQSPTDWTLVRLPMIELTDDMVAVQANEQDCPGEKISAASLARFLSSQLHSDTYIRKSPFVANQ